MIIPQTSPHFQLQNEIRVTSQELNPFFSPKYKLREDHCLKTTMLEKRRLDFSSLYDKFWLLLHVTLHNSDVFLSVCGTI